MAESGKFTRTVEDFTCEHCGTVTEGTGYTNHCPSCLWSKHVDMNPGDRESPCGGMMEPVELVLDGQEYSIVHRCEWCGLHRKNKTASNDRKEAIVALSYRAKK